MSPVQESEDFSLSDIKSDRKVPAYVIGDKCTHGPAEDGLVSLAGIIGPSPDEVREAVRASGGRASEIFYKC